MAKRVNYSTLNASTMDILNVIHRNASYDYQQNVPVVEQYTDIPKVGEVLFGTPALLNQFINALINRIALVQATSLTFNNPYAILKKGYLEFGETVEEIFVQIAKVVEYNPDKAPGREFKRTLPDVRSAFHVMNWRVFYPLTIQEEDLKRAFTSMDGVTDLIARLVDSIYTAAEYDEYLLFKYMLIKAIAHGKMKPESIGDGSDLTDAATQFRAISNVITFPSTTYNEMAVKNNTPKDRQIIFMDARFDAQFDVEVLAAAFHMEKADYIGRRFLIDNWNTFDNERFETIRANSDGLEEVTADELALMDDVKAVLIDDRWFQIYDNNNKFTEQYSANGLYWNYFYHVWKTVSNSPFANAVVFVTEDATITDPAEVTFTIASKDVSDDATVLTFELDPASSATLQNMRYNFIQPLEFSEDGVAVQQYGALIIPASKVAEEYTLELEIGGVKYVAGSVVTGASDVGDTITFAPESSSEGGSEGGSENVGG